VSKSVVKVVVSADGRQEAKFRRDSDGTYRFSVLQFYDADPNNPYEKPPGWWSPIWQSGIYASLEEAERNLADEGWPWVSSIHEGLPVVSRGK
jgi:hypothetical protein